MYTYVTLLTDMLCVLTPTSSNVGPSAATSSAEQLAWGTWDWDGRFHRVPRGWRFPRRHGVKIVFLEWTFGNRGRRPPIMPLRFLCKNDVSKEGTQYFFSIYIETLIRIFTSTLMNCRGLEVYFQRLRQSPGSWSYSIRQSSLLTSRRMPSPKFLIPPSRHTCNAYTVMTDRID